MEGKDGQVRVANIRTAGGVTNRPISKLYPLELMEPKDNDQAVAREKETKEVRVPVEETLFFLNLLSLQRRAGKKSLTATGIEPSNLTSARCASNHYAKFPQQI